MSLSNFHVVHFPRERKKKSLMMGPALELLVMILTSLHLKLQNQKKLKVRRKLQLMVKKLEVLRILTWVPPLAVNMLSPIWKLVRAINY